MSVTQISTHIEDAKERLIQQYKNKENIESLVESLNQEIQTLEDLFFNLKDGRTIDGAVGEQLDQLGLIVGVQRQAGESDEDYRKSIKEQIILNVNQGTPENVIQAVKFFFDAEYVWMLEMYPASVEIFISEEVAPADLASVIASINRFLPAGVSLQTFGFFPAPNAFRFDVGVGFGDTTDPLVGDLLAEVY